MKRRTLLLASLVPISTDSALIFSLRKSESIVKILYEWNIDEIHSGYEQIEPSSSIELLGFKLN
jgi:hypothetical protein